MGSPANDPKYDGCRKMSTQHNYHHSHHSQRLAAVFIIIAVVIIFMNITIVCGNDDDYDDDNDGDDDGDDDGVGNEGYDEDVYN